MSDADSGAPEAVLERAVRAGADAALDLFRTPLDVETKAGKMDAVTRADHAVQERVIETLARGTGPAAVVAEEGDRPTSVPETGRAWVVDPIDGTVNFARGGRLWAVSAALVAGGSPIAAATSLPAVGDRYVAGDCDDRGAPRRGDAALSVSARTDPETFAVATVFGLRPAHREASARLSGRVVRRFGDLRRLGSAQATLAMVAAGELDAAVSAVRLDPWDTVAGAHLVRRAGGTVTDRHGGRWRHDSAGLVASNGRAHDALLDALEDESCVD